MVTPVTCYVTVIPYCQPAVSLANVHTSYQTHASFRCRPCFVLHTNKVNCGFDSIYWRWDSKGNDNGAGEEKGTKAGPSRRFTPKEELFITLLRLRRGFSLQAIAYIFEVSASLVSTIFITWIQFIFLQFKAMQVPMFPSKDILKASLPEMFRNFRNVRCSVDCTEFFCQVPRDYAQQGNVYSSYKHHTTMKALIAVTVLHPKVLLVLYLTCMKEV